MNGGMEGPSPLFGAGAHFRPRLVAAGLGLLAALLLATLLVLVQRANDTRDAALARKQHSFNVVILTSDVDGALARAEAALGRYVTDGDSETGTLYYDEWRRAGQGLDALQSLTRDNPEQVRRTAALQQLYVKRGAELARPAALASYKRGWSALGMLSKAGRSDTLPRMRRLLRDIAEQERALLDARSTAAALSVDQSNALSLLLSGVGVLLTITVIGAAWAAINAVVAQRIAKANEAVESDRAARLQEAVAQRTQELSAANARLLEEAATREEAEAKLRQVQKLEAVGQLTGGIAHDFNNMLAVVLGGLELARKRVSDQALEATRHIDNAMEGANRAAALTRRLLSFARNEPLLPSATDPAQLIAGMADLVDRTIGERIEIRYEADPGAWPVWVDPFQLENAILNLCVNARDAMEGVGLLRIEATNATVSDGAIGQLPAGDYVRIAVIDAGKGMSPAVLDRVFEPFFTTKPVGKGTGLGLSQIFGFARQSGGDVVIQSKEGAGTTVALYLPRHRGAVMAVETKEDAPVEVRAGAKILVVEDDVRVRAATGEALLELGFLPILCSAADDAEALLRSHPDIALLITDVIMPNITGPELVAALAPRFPDLPVLFVTGYFGEAGEPEGLSGHAVLRKPFTMNQLAKAVATALAPKLEVVA